jgi:hypothetical protein
MLHIAGVIFGLVLLVMIILEAFETIVLPRTAARDLRLSRLTNLYGWRVWTAIARSVRNTGRREYFLSCFAPLQMPAVLAIWAFGLVVGFGLMLWGIQEPIQGPSESMSLGGYLYLSGTTFFTLGYGDLTPVTASGRFLAVLEAGFGLGFLAVIIGYFPILYGAFSQREISISLLDARAGTPPTASEFLRRHSARDDLDTIPQILREWEQWSAQLLESNLSYPVLAMYRSQHDRESWLSALTMILDVCSLLLVGVDGIHSGQAKLTFAMARHAAIDTGLVFDVKPVPPAINRLPPDTFAELREILRKAGVPLAEGADSEQKLSDLRRLYEPYVNTLSQRFLMDLPPWIAAPDAVDNWQTSAWSRDTKGDLHF